MNQGAVRSSPVQQMVAAGSPNWWSINNTRPPPPYHHNHPFLATPPPQNHLPHDQLTPPPLSASSSWNHDNSQDLPESWSQLLLGGLVSEEDKGTMVMSHMQQGKKLENWEHDFLNQSSNVKPGDDCHNYGPAENEFQAPKPDIYNWTHLHQIMSSDANSPKSSSVTSLSSNMLDFSHRFSAGKQDLSSHECNSTGTGGPATKKARIQPSSAQSTFKVRKEKLGDRITALHQLVSPFGKTDTASVLLEAIGYIRFLQSQVEALSLPYLGSGSRNPTRHHPVQGERNSLFPDDPGQLLNEKCTKRKISLSEQECDEEPKKDLRTRGLSLVPISCMLQVGNDNGADYWAPAFSGNFQ